MHRILTLLWACTLLLAGCNLPARRAATLAAPTPTRAAPALSTAGGDAGPTPTAAPGPAQPSPTSAAPPPAQPSPTPAPTVDAAQQGRLEELDAYFSAQAEAGIFGGAVLVAQGGRVLLDKGYGLADTGHKLDFTPQTRFRIASLTKQFTAAAMLMLEAQGQLDVQDPVCRYLKDCPEAWQAITLQQLLTHSSGIPDFFTFKELGDKMASPMTPDELVAWYQQKPLVFTPGKLYNYSNSGYNVLGDVIERVSGQSYADFLKQRIFDPLHMDDTGYDRTADIPAQGYTRNGTSAVFLEPSLLFAAGGLYSTVEDLYRWDQALYTQDLVSQRLLDEMFQPRIAVPNQPGTSYAYGWVVDSSGPHLQLRHHGMIDGYVSLIMRFPDEDATVIILCNRDDFPIYAAGDRAASAVLGGD